jgi:hypothetical protein
LKPGRFAFFPSLRASSASSRRWARTDKASWRSCDRVLDQGSRLSAVRLAGGHAVGATLGMVGFDEDDLYANLDWLADNQAKIESRAA